MGQKAAVGALAAIAADFDFLPGLMVGHPGRFHHAESHSILFAYLVALLASVLTKRTNRGWTLLAGLSYASHLVLDLVTTDNSLPSGIPLFWPWSEVRFQSPITLFPNVPWGSSWRLSDNINLLLRELGFLGPIFIGSLTYARRCTARANRTCND
jgi:inner membrane protein